MGKRPKFNLLLKSELHRAPLLSENIFQSRKILLWKLFSWTKTTVNDKRKGLLKHITDVIIVWELSVPVPPAIVRESSPPKSTQEIEQPCLWGWTN